ncbi:MAG: bifunctional 4'-phosphopantothenoylcysteine decarboxylase/phosphopantothenoylcysteine synthetase, partial [Clostridia bacterium]|nr:bifunctional 4'-phosphopantothenoylcysteine decarboxylase/phosphopantothenoylcysteine synthetase [Clostridia bacterium]
MRRKKFTKGKSLLRSNNKVNKNVLLGVSGGIAAYKSCEIVSRLKKLGYDVKVLMTQNA